MTKQKGKRYKDLCSACQTGCAAKQACMLGERMSFMWVSMSKLRRLFLPLWFLPLFIHCLFSGDVLVNFFLKIPSFLSCAKRNKEKGLYVLSILGQVF